MYLSIMGIKAHCTRNEQNFHACRTDSGISRDASLVNKLVGLATNKHTFPIFPIIPVFLLASYNFIFFKKIPIFY